MAMNLQCSRCGEEFDAKMGRQVGAMNYCGYCEAVVFGQDGELASWPPKVTRQEYRELRKARGAHITEKP